MSERPTLKSLGDRLESVESRVAAIRDVDDEARALSRCVQALDALQKADRTRGTDNYLSLPMSGGYGGNGYNYQPLYDTPTGPVPRVLDYLRQRYRLPDPSTEAQRLSAELQRAYARIGDLEGRLQQISGAVSA